MSIIKTENICKSFGSVEVLKNVSLTVEPGEVVVIIGPSGAGKSTFLRSLNRLEKTTGGKIWIDDKLVEDRVNGHNQVKMHQKERAAILLEMGMVFQRFNLFPHKTALQNVMLAPMTVKHVLEKDAREKAVKLLEQVGLGDKLDAYPAKLSGGQQQRVALARALVIEPSVLLFDEPLSNLDAKLRITMRTEIRKIQQKVGITAIYVTHDQSEAMSISDKIIIMSKGQVEQIGTPREIYYHPASKFVADFIGEANFLDAKVKSVSGDKALIQITGKELEVNNFAGAKAGDTATLVIRPEGASLAESGVLEVTVTLSTFMGSYQYYEAMLGDTEIQITDYNPINRRIYEAGEKAYLDFDPRGVYIL